MAIKAVIHLRNDLVLFKPIFFEQNTMTLLALNTLILDMEIVIEEIHLPIRKYRDIGISILFVMTLITAFP